MKKKVLIVLNECLRRGGSQAVIMSIVKGLSTKYLFDILLFTSEEAYYDEEFKSYGGNIYRIPNYEGNNKIRKKLDIYLRWIWHKKKVKKILENKYDIIHCINGFESGYVLKLAKKAQISIRISMTATITNANALRKIYNSFWLKRIMKYSTANVGCSKEACETMYEKNYCVIPNSYRKEFDVPIIKREFDDPALIQIASFGSNKNQLFTIKTFNEVLKEYPKALLHLVGYELEKGYVDKINSLVEQLQIKDNVIIHKANANTVDLLNNSTHLLLPSHKESFGIVLLEAQARGLKCIVSDTVSDAANCGGCIYLPINDGEKIWADYIVDDFSKNKGQHQEYDLTSFKEDYILKQYEDLYEGKLK